MPPITREAGEEVGMLPIRRAHTPMQISRRVQVSAFSIGLGGITSGPIISAGFNTESLAALRALLVRHVLRLATKVFGQDESVDSLRLGIRMGEPLALARIEVPERL